MELAILGDPGLGERQKQALLEVYESFRSVSERVHSHDPAHDPAQQPAHVDDVTHTPTDVEAGDPGQATPTEGS